MKIARKAGPRPVEEYFEEPRHLGLEWLERGCEAPANFPQTFDYERVARIRDLGQKYGMDYYLHSVSCRHR